MLGKQLQSPHQQFRCTRKATLIHKARMTACKASNGSAQREAQLIVQDMHNCCFSAGGVSPVHRSRCLS
jgi:hypothetical protein